MNREIRTNFPISSLCITLNNQTENGTNFCIKKGKKGGKIVIYIKNFPLYKIRVGPGENSTKKMVLKATIFF